MFRGKLMPLCVGILAAAVFAGCGQNAIERSKDFTRQGFELYKKRQYAEAVKAFETALELNPGNARAKYYMGVAYKDYEGMADNIAAAEKALEGAIAADVTMLEAYVMLCSIHIKQKAYEKAEKVANRAIKVHNDKAEPHYWLAQSYAQREMYDEALAKCKTALRMDPTHAPSAALQKQIEDVAGY